MRIDRDFVQPQVRGGGVGHTGASSQTSCRRKGHLVSYSVMHRIKDMTRATRQVFALMGIVLLSQAGCASRRAGVITTVVGSGAALGATALGVAAIATDDRDQRNNFMAGGIAWGVISLTTIGVGVAMIYMADDPPKSTAAVQSAP